MFLSPRDADVPTDRWVTGDRFGLSIPADAGALREGGSGFLTAAFRASGALDAADRVTRIVAAEPFHGGGTGAKLRLRVAYEQAANGLPEALFVKFSRNFEDALRDRGRAMMVSEVHFAVASRSPDFPVKVPRCLFADVEEASATGLLVTECIPYGEGRVEPHYPKCLDRLVPEPVEHYRAILRGLARLSGAHRAGALSSEFDERFPADPAAMAAFGIYAPEERLRQWANRMFDFIARHPRLFAERLHDSSLRDRFLAYLADVVAADARIREVLGSRPEFLAFAHWNANIDNCWFERDAHGALECGFIDWANAGRISVAQSILGAISSADASVWSHLDELLESYADAFEAQGAPRLDVAELRRHVLLLAAVSGVGFSMGAPVALEREIPDLDAVGGPDDDVFVTHENARIQLHMMTSLLEHWIAFDLGDLIRTL